MTAAMAATITRAVAAVIMKIAIAMAAEGAAAGIATEDIIIKHDV